MKRTGGEIDLTGWELDGFDEFLIDKINPIFEQYISTHIASLIHKVLSADEVVPFFSPDAKDVTRMEFPLYYNYLKTDPVYSFSLRDAVDEFISAYKDKVVPDSHIESLSGMFKQFAEELKQLLGE